MLQIGWGGDILAAIREAPRAVIFISVPWSGPERTAREVFRDAASRLEGSYAELGIRFFILEIDEDEASQHWLASVGLLHLATAGAGSVIWLDRSCLVSSEVNANVLGVTGVVARSISLWQGQSQPSTTRDSGDSEM
jgi:hypothetical protein